ncbi:hypothetical protein MNBD_CHLOROFLEXI01-1452 [hydrothermal vent metagenome]|uniref:Extracellular nuclease n=1 Tax=hydrothermal vent metagenome TaxID=652676 RepID=A0A3B0VZT9_9ZZZZ
MQNITIFDGNTPSNGGGIYNSGILTVTNSTLSSNSANNGGGIYNNSGTTTVTNSTFSGNSANNDGGGILNGSNTAPLLGPLQDNGGPTFTHALLSGSPAINAGNTALTTDQRGVARPQGSNDDIGAFERDVYKIFLPFINNSE